VHDPITQRWSDLEPLVKALLDVTPEHRQAWLEQHCPDPQQRAAVLELARSDASVEGALPRLCRELAASTDDLSTAQVGPYRLIEKIGEGGMAVVYLAQRDAPDSPQRVAVKLMRGGVCGRDQLALFQREQRLHASLEHPHIARVFDTGISAGGIPYFAMEYVDGERITHWCNARALGLTRRLELFLLVCEAVQCAHANLVVHRDLKPSNILVTQDGTPKLLDFGIARLVHATTDGDTANEEPQTRTAIRFTPGYAAPEQLSGDTLTTATDVYALGILLHELLTGVRPQLRDGTACLASRRLAALDAAHITVSATERGMTPTALIDALRGNLDNLIAKALRGESARRYRDAQELAQDVRRYLAGQPIGARPEPLAYRMGTYLRQRRSAIVGAVALATILTGIFVGVYLWRVAPARLATQRAEGSAGVGGDAKSIAVLPFENLSEDRANAYFASGMRDEILTRLAGIRDLRVISRTSTDNYASRPGNLREIGEQLGVAALLEGSVQKVGDMAHVNVQLIDAHDDRHLWARSYDRELSDIFGVERDVAEHIAQSLQATLLPDEAARIAIVPTQNTEAYDLYLRGLEHFNRGDDYFVVPRETPQALKLYEQALEKDPNFALAQAGIALAHLYMYWFAPDRTNERLETAKLQAQQALAREPSLGDGHLALALYHYWGHHDYQAAREQLDIARSLMPNNPRVETFAAAIARRQGQWETAIAGFKRTALLDPRNSSPYLDLGATYAALRRYADTEKVTARAAELSADSVTPLLRRGFNTVAWKGDLADMRNALQSPIAQGAAAAVATSRFMLAWWSRDYAQAIREAESDTQDSWVFFTSTVLPRKLYLAWAQEAAGQTDAAHETYKAVYQSLQIALQERPDDADLHKAAGLAAAGLGMQERAIAQARQATALMPTTKDAISGPAYLDGLARTYVRIGKPDDAIAVLEQLMAIPAGFSVTPALLKLDPMWDPLRADARFQKLIDSSNG
jgi:serine/threonine-protein kinase